jgi:hypothetical protein
MTEKKVQKETERNIEREKDNIDEYKKGLTQQERMVMKIAEEHLETSFDITKNIGYLEWKKTRSMTTTTTEK